MSGSLNGLAALACATTAALLAVPSIRASSPVGARRRADRRSDRERAADAGSSAHGTVASTAAVMVAAMGAGWLLFGTVGIAIGVPGGVVLARWVDRLEPRAVAAERAAIRADLPVAADLLAACCCAGRAPTQSLDVVADAVGGPLGRRLAEVDARLALGAPPGVEWSRLAHDPLLGGLGRVLARSGESGAPLVRALERLATDERRRARGEAQERARNVSVRAAAPLALCFLPAFMLLGIVPAVAGGFIRLLG